MANDKNGAVVAVGDRVNFEMKGIYREATRDYERSRREGVVLALAADQATVGFVHLDVLFAGTGSEVRMPRVATVTVKLAECIKVG